MPSTIPTPSRPAARQTPARSSTAPPPRATHPATRRNHPSTHGGATMHARIDNPAVTVPGALKALQGIGQRGQAGRHPRDDAVSRRAAREPDQRLRRLRRHPLPRAQARGRTRPSASTRSPPGGRRPVLHRGRAGRSGAHRGGHPSRRPAGPRSGRRVGRRRAPLRRGAARRAGARDRRDQRLESHQRRPRGRSRETGSASGSKRAGRTERQPDPGGSTAPAVRYGERRRRAPLAIMFEQAASQSQRKWEGEMRVLFSTCPAGVWR